jgi:hypothetical protein
MVASHNVNSKQISPELQMKSKHLRPRKTLGFQTPADKLQASVASTP